MLGLPNKGHCALQRNSLFFFLLGALVLRYGLEIKVKMMKKKFKNICLQSFAIVIALAVITTGIRPLLKGDYFYRNWWGGLVFGPITIIGGLLFLYVVVFKWEKLKKMK